MEGGAGETLVLSIILSADDDNSTTGRRATQGPIIQPVVPEGGSALPDV